MYCCKDAGCVLRKQQREPALLTKIFGNGKLGLDLKAKMENSNEAQMGQKQPINVLEEMAVKLGLG